MDVELAAAPKAADPFPLYRRMRETSPVAWSPTLDGWVLTRYEDCLALLKDSRFSADRLSPFLQAQSPDRRQRFSRLAETLKDWVLLLDPPDHSRVRGLMNQAFSPAAAEAMRPRIRQVVAALLDEVADSGRMDAVADFAYPLPALVIAEMIGVPVESRDEFKTWSDDIAAFVGSFDPEPAVMEAAQEALVRMQGFFEELIAARRDRPKRDLLSELIAAGGPGGRLVDGELFANCGFLLFAGHETTTNLIGSGLYHLLRAPDQVDRLIADPELVPRAVEEFLRFDPPVDRISRIAKEDHVFAGIEVRRGQRVIALTAAANRDPERFPEPDALDVGRSDNRHLAFGYGPHFCIGAPLARVEAQEAFAALLSRLSDMRLAGADVEWTDTLGFRGPRRLLLTF